MIGWWDDGGYGAYCLGALFACCAPLRPTDSISLDDVIRATVMGAGDSEVLLSMEEISISMEAAPTNGSDADGRSVGREIAIDIGGRGRNAGSIVL